MKASLDILAKFRNLYFEEFGEHLSDNEALDRLSRLTNVLRVLYPHSDTQDTDIYAAPFDDPRETATLKAP